MADAIEKARIALEVLKGPTLPGHQMSANTILSDALEYLGGGKQKKQGGKDGK